MSIVMRLSTRTLVGGLVLLSISWAGFAQDEPSARRPTAALDNGSQSPSQEQIGAEANEQTRADRSPLEVQPGPPVITNKDLYEGPGYIHPFSQMPRYILRDQKAIWTSPFHTPKAAAKYWVLFGAATVGLIATDKWTVEGLPNTSGQVHLGTFASRLGAAYSLIPITAGCYFVGSAAHNDRFRETGLMSFEALVDTTIVETILKISTQRERPLQGSGYGEFWSGKGSIGNASFPSGHVINTWALASLWAHQYRHKIIVPVIAYGIGATVIGARLAARKHFPGDVVPAAAMGWFIGDYVYARRHNSELDSKRSVVDAILTHIRIGGTPH